MLDDGERVVIVLLALAGVYAIINIIAILIP
jgi:hypothetical protein